MAQRFERHHRAEIGAADADVDDVADALAGMPSPCARAHALAPCGHAREHRMHLGHHIAPVDEQAPPPRHAQRHMQGRTVLGAVDALAGEHRRDAFGHAAHLRQRQQQFERAGIESLLGEVEVPAGGFDREAFATLRVSGEKLAQVAALHDSGVTLQRLPCSAGRERRRGRGASRGGFHLRTLLRCGAALNARRRPRSS